MSSLSLIMNCNRYTFRYFGLQLSQDGCWHDVEWEAKDDRWCNYEEEDDNGLSPWGSINTYGKNERLRVSCNMVLLACQSLISWFFLLLDEINQYSWTWFELLRIGISLMLVVALYTLCAIRKVETTATCFMRSTRTV